jgi:hypothetical protein
MFGRGKNITNLVAVLAGMLAATASVPNRGERDPLSKLYIANAKKKVMKDSSFREAERRRKQIKAGWHPVVYSWRDVNTRVNQGE